MKKKAVVFTIADDRNMPYAKQLANSLRKFYTQEELPLLIYSPEPKALKKDPQLFYRATPTFAKDLIKEYELVIKIDADSIICGNLDHILEDKTYDVGTVLNWNAVDAKLYGLVSVFNISPGNYFNCGLVAMRSQEFVDHWYNQCHSSFFDTLQYREQDLLNIILYYGNYQFKCFDWEHTWNGLIAKGHWPKAIIRGEDIIIEKNGQFPESDKVLKVIHWAGGSNADKMNYRVAFSDEVILRLDYLIGGEK